jgi:DNA ligase-1
MYYIVEIRDGIEESNILKTITTNELNAEKRRKKVLKTIDKIGHGWYNIREIEIDMNVTFFFDEYNILAMDNTMKNAPQEIIKSLKADGSSNKKIEILKEVFKDETNNEAFISLCKLALDTYITFGVKNVPKGKDNGKKVLPLEDFVDVLDKLETRQLTGNNAKEAISNLVDKASKDEWDNFYSLILQKDLKCGVSVKTWNKAAPKKHQVSVFSCQLAHDGANHEKKIVGKKLLEVKLDGVRVITVVKKNGSVNMYSRNGKELSNFSKIGSAFAKIAKDLKEDTVFDGEVMSSSFQDLMKQVHRKEDVQTDDAVLYLFDTLPLSDFIKGKCTLTQTQRSSNVATYVKAINDTCIRFVSQVMVDLDDPKGHAEFKRINQEAIQGGYEGIMVKNPEAIYECKRSTSWLKIKPFIEVSLEVKDLEEGTGRNEGRLGAFICEGIDDGKQIFVNVGTGFSDDDRSNYWADRNSIVGAIIEVRADAITQNQDGTYSLRFPRFKTFRGFEKGEKL